MNWHALEITKVFEELKSSLKGLSETDAANRIAKYGSNRLVAAKPKRKWAILISQLKSPVVYLLFIAAGVSFFFSDLTESLAILAVVVINTVIGFVMELQAVQSMQALKKYDKNISKVFRNGVLREIDSVTLVPGDLLFMEAGDIVPADARVIQYSNLTLNESALTGESLPVQKNSEALSKNTILAERKNQLYKGTAVTAGNGKAVVTSTGMHTEIGKISSMVHEAHEEKIPLNEKLEVFSKKLIGLILVIILPFFILGYFTEKDLYLMIETAIALAVSAIPEGLPIVATISLAKGMLKLAKHKVIVKKLAAVETLGETNVIFSDKTGTLTENELEVDTVCTADNSLSVDWDFDKHNLHFLDKNKRGLQPISLEKLLEVAVLCNNASFYQEELHAGDPLEVALLKFSAYYKEEFTEGIKKTAEKIEEQPFDSDTKFMGTLHKRGAVYMTSAKGAVEEILNKCDHVLTKDGILPLPDEEKKEWLNQTEKIAANGLKVLAFAYREGREQSKLWINELTFIGLIGFLDPPREDVPEAIKACKDAGIEVIMVTGDHPATAQNISHLIGLTEEPNALVIHGADLKEFSELSEIELALIEKCKIFSRVTPYQKLELIRHSKDKGNIVAMTGDGVNDAPALKKADIGIAMGIRGTQVAREAADMVLQDDAFPSIVKAIRQGRIIYTNIKNFIIYLLSCNLSEILVVAIAAFSNLAMPLLPIQILFLNVVTDVFPALALGMGKGNPSVMEFPPRNPTEPLLNKKNWKSIIIYAIVLTVSVLGVFLYGLFYENYSNAVCNNIAFLTLALAQLLHPLNLIRAKDKFFKNDIINNPHLWAAVVLCIAIITAVFYIPYTNEILALQVLNMEIWILIAIGSIAPVLIIQFLKQIKLIY